MTALQLAMTITATVKMSSEGLYFRTKNTELMIKPPRVTVIERILWLTIEATTFPLFTLEFLDIKYALETSPLTDSAGTRRSTKDPIQRYRNAFRKVVLIERRLSSRCQVKELKNILKVMETNASE